MSNLGPYQLNSIVTGDNAAILAQLPAGCIDLTVTSPPYDNLRTYNGYEWDFEAVASQLWRVTKEGGVVVWVVNDETINGGETLNSLRQAIRFQEIGFTVHDTMIYRKDSAPFPESNRYYPCFEYMFVLSKNKPATVNLIQDRKPSKAGGHEKSSIERQPNGHIRRPQRHYIVSKSSVRHNIWTYGTGNMKTTKDAYVYANHPAVFPEALAHDHIVSWSNPGDIVLDPFVGSGTTAKMALLAGRHFIGIDISEEYCELARRRVAEAAAKTPEALADGRAKPGGKVDTAGLPLFEALL